MPLKNTTWTLDFLKKVSRHRSALRDWWQEQRAFIDVMMQLGPEQSERNNTHIHVLGGPSKRLLQSYPHMKDAPPGDYETGDWIVHFPGEFCKNREACKREALRLGNVTT